MRVLLSDEEEVISVTPEMLPSARSNGVATVVAMVSGLAPGKEAETEMVGKSTCGSGATGNSLKPIRPASTMPKVIRVVAIGRRMKGSEKFMGSTWRGPSDHSSGPLPEAAAAAGAAPLRSRHIRARAAKPR